MAGGIIGEVVNGAMWGAGLTLVLAGVGGVILGSLGKNLDLDKGTRDAISLVLG